MKRSHAGKRASEAAGVHVRRPMKTPGTRTPAALMVTDQFAGLGNGVPKYEAAWNIRVFITAKISSIFHKGQHFTVFPLFWMQNHRKYLIVHAFILFSLYI